MHERVCYVCMLQLDGNDLFDIMFVAAKVMLVDVKVADGKTKQSVIIADSTAAAKDMFVGRKCKLPTKPKSYTFRTSLCNLTRITSFCPCLGKGRSAALRWERQVSLSTAVSVAWRYLQQIHCLSSRRAWESVDSEAHSAAFNEFAVFVFAVRRSLLIQKWDSFSIFIYRLLRASA